MAKETGCEMETTSPRMEYAAIRTAQEWMANNQLPYDTVIICSSSKNTVETLNEFYPKRLADGTTNKIKNVDIIRQIYHLRNSSSRPIYYMWSGGKSKNKLCDMAASAAHSELAK